MKMLMILTTLMLIGCAKELPENISDDIQESGFELALFNQDVTLETAGDGDDTLAASAEASQILALNETRLYSIVIIRGSDEFAPFFKDLKIEAEGRGQKFIVSFSLTKNNLVAYLETSKNKLPKIYNGFDTELNAQIPLFQYAGVRYGKLERVKNELGEETRTIAFVEKDRDQATHVTVNPKSIHRQLGSLRGLSSQDDKNELFVKNRLHKKRWTFGELKKVFTIAKNVLDLPLDEKVITIIDGGQIYVLKMTNLNQLTVMEKTALAQTPRDLKLIPCQEIDLTLPKDCIFKPVLSQQAPSKVLKRQLDDNEEVATITLETDEDHQSRLVQIDRGQTFSEFQIGKEVILEDGLLLKSASFDTESRFLYVPSTLSSPREVVNASPFFQGDHKIVKMRWIKEGLQIVQFEADERFNKNDLNYHPVMLIPGEHVDVSDKDKKGLSTGSYRLDRSKPELERAYFIPDFKSARILEKNTLDIFGVEDFMGCLSTTQTELKNFQVSKETINLVFERSFKVGDSVMCWISLFLSDSFNVSSFKTQFLYSMTNYDALRSKNYKPHLYPDDEKSTYGFFATEINRLNDNYDKKELVRFLSRFNPNKDFIDYYLSESFNKPENQYLKQETYASFDRMNQGLAKARAKIRLRLNEPNSDIIPGDVRYSMINLIDEPLENGLLGYGPSIDDPLTGEILSARTNMYSGSLTSMVPSAYRDLVNISRLQVLEKKNALSDEIEEDQDFKGNEETERIRKEIRAAIAKWKEENKRKEEEEDEDEDLPLELLLLKQMAKIKAGVIHKPQSTKSLMLENFEQLKIDQKAIDQLIVASRTIDQRMRDLSKQKNRFENVFSFKDNVNLKKRILGTKTDDQEIDLTEEYEQMLEIYSKNNAYHQDFFKFSGLANANLDEIAAIPGILNKDGILLSWESLNQSQRRQVTKIVVLYAYRATLIHEVGHNLGLRHNFQGTFDKVNWYSKDEAAANGLKGIPESSSMMDYQANVATELNIFGRYDIAALKFAYAGYVEGTVQGTDGLSKNIDLPLSGSLANTQIVAANSGVTLTSYRFCTDENAGTATGCDRFDVGTTIDEIATNYINDYYNTYYLRNWKGERSDFSLQTDLMRYIVRLDSRFGRIADIFEDWETFTKFIPVSIMQSGCSAALKKNPNLKSICEMIQDRLDAAKRVGNFFLGVLETPDLTCAVKKVPIDGEEETFEVEYLLLKSIYEDNQFDVFKNSVPTNCYDPMVTDILKQDPEGAKMVVGQQGQYFLPIDDPTSSVFGDVITLGIWPDKLLAMKALTNRYPYRTSTEEIKMSMVDLPALTPRFDRFMKHITLGTDQGRDAAKFIAPNGKIKPLEKSTSVKDDSYYTIPEQISARVARALALPLTDDVQLNKMLLNDAKYFNTSVDSTGKVLSEKTVKNFTVTKLDPIKDRVEIKNDSQKIRLFTNDDAIYLAKPENAIAYRMFQDIEDLPILIASTKKEIDLIMDIRNRKPSKDQMTSDEISLVQMIPSMDEIKEIRDVLVAMGTNTSTIDPNLQPPPWNYVFKLGVEGLTNLMDKFAEAQKLPDDASENLKLLNVMNYDAILEFVYGDLRSNVENYENKLLIMPAWNQNTRSR